ncbi:MAG: hypothetical protein ACK417_04845 [Bacteroidia bacterium]
MKKVLLITAIALFLNEGVSAQKAASGDLTLEGQVSLWGPTQVVAPIIRARYFLSDDLAARVQLGYFSNSSTTNFAENPDGTGGTGSVTRTNSLFDLRLGAEKHFGENDRFSPYFGAEFMFGIGSATESWSNAAGLGGGYDANTSATITGGWGPGGNPQYAPGSRIGLNLIVGADYYIFEQLYVGAEFGYGFMSLSGSDEVAEVSVGGTTNKFVSPGGSSNSLGMYNMVGGLRVGMKF